MSTFEKATPESLGIPSGAITMMLDAMKREKVDLNSFVILRHGKLAAEGWYDPYKPEFSHAVHSFTKTLTSTAIGLMVSEGLISVSDKVVSFFPESVPESPSENLKKMEVRHLLSMTCGHETECGRFGGDFIKTFLAHPVKREPGTYFVYNTTGTNMLSAIILRVTGQNLTEYLKPRLFDPLGITDYFCSKSPGGIELGGGGMCLRTRDMAKICQLYLQNGQWEGKQLVPAEWIREATSAHIIQAEGWYPTINSGMEDYFSGYGYQLWLNCVPGSYRLDGMYGQLGVILPKFDMVIVTTAATLRIYKVLTTIWRTLIPALTEGALPEDKAALSALEDKIASLAVEWPAPGPRSSLEKEISGHIIRFAKNDYSVLTERSLFFSPAIPYTSREGIEQMSLTFHGDVCGFSFTEHGVISTVPLGLDGKKLPGKVNLNNLEAEVLSTGVWTDERTFRIDMLHIHSVYHRIIEIKFMDDREAELKFAQLPNDADDSANERYIPSKTFLCTLR